MFYYTVYCTISSQLILSYIVFITVFSSHVFNFPNTIHHVPPFIILRCLLSSCCVLGCPMLYMIWYDANLSRYIVSYHTMHVSPCIIPYSWHDIMVWCDKICHDMLWYPMLHVWYCIVLHFCFELRNTHIHIIHTLYTMPFHAVWHSVSRIMLHQYHNILLYWLCADKTWQHPIARTLWRSLYHSIAYHAMLCEVMKQSYCTTATALLKTSLV